MENIIKVSTLTEKELQVLALWACGQTLKETAQCLRLSVHAVRYYRCKLGCGLRPIDLGKDHETLARMGRNLVIQRSRLNKTPVTWAGAA